MDCMNSYREEMLACSHVHAPREVWPCLGALLSLDCSFREVPSLLQGIHGQREGRHHAVSRCYGKQLLLTGASETSFDRL